MPGHFLVFPFGLLWSEVTASNLLLMDNKACAAAVPLVEANSASPGSCAFARGLLSLLNICCLKHYSFVPAHGQATDYNHEHCNKLDDSCSTYKNQLVPVCSEMLYVAKAIQRPQLSGSTAGSMKCTQLLAVWCTLTNHGQQPSPF